MLAQPSVEAIRGLVTERAPRLFAVVAEPEDPGAVRIAAWGMAFADHAEVVSEDGASRMCLRSPEFALHLFGCGGREGVRLVWLGSGAEGA